MPSTRSLTAGLTLLALLSACQPADTVSGLRCDPQRHQVLVGQNVGAITLPPGLPKRIISPGDPVTEDFSADRLNIFVDPKGWIARISCG